MKRKLEDLELRSESVQAVLSEPPSRMLRYGITVIFGMLLLLLAVTCFVRYPDVIQANATVSSANPPQSLETRINSKIAILNVREARHVHKGEVVAVLESSANYYHVLRLKKMAARASQKIEISELDGLSLGDIQPAFTAFIKAYTDATLDSKLKPYEQVIATGSISERENNSRLASLYAQQRLEKSKLELSEQQYKRALDLYNKGVISAADLDNQKSSLIQAKQAFDQITLSISQQKEAISVSKKQVSEGKISKEKSEVTGAGDVSLALAELKKSIRDWERDYVIVAPVDGIVSLQGSWRENQSVNAGEILASLLPDDRSDISGGLTVAPQNSGKIEKGQEVLLRLDNYPYQEFGIVTGKVISMSALPDKEGNYFVSVSLPQGLRTSYGKEIKFDKALTGSAQIITRDMKLIQRIFYGVLRMGR